jgi:nitrous oxide reductase accessory protein NosL
MRTTLLAVLAAGALLTGCNTSSAPAPRSTLPAAIDVSNMTKAECQAVRRMSLRQGASSSEVDRRVNCADARW